MKTLQTPFFLFDVRKQEAELDLLKSALATHWPGYRIAYSVKTNSLPALARFFCERGVDAEVVSEDEYRMVRAAGYGPDAVVCNGPVKREAWIAELLDAEVTVNLDSNRELRFVADYAARHPERRISVGLRVNPDIESAFPGESNAGAAESRFGFCTENGSFAAAVASLRACPNVSVTGLHLHVSTKTRRPEIYGWLAGQFVSLVRTYGLDAVSLFDIGGGFFGGIPGKPGWDDYLRAIAAPLAEAGCSPDTLCLMLEPGVSLLAGAFSYHTAVVDVKEVRDTRFVVCDGSRIHVDPLMHKGSYFHTVERCGISAAQGDSETECIAAQQLVGFTCLENDRFFTLTDEAPLQEGDRLVFDKVGAYTMTLSPLFISYFPAVYSFGTDGTIRCMRERWTEREFMQRSCLEPRLLNK